MLLSASLIIKIILVLWVCVIHAFIPFLPGSCIMQTENFRLVSLSNSLGERLVFWCYNYEVIHSNLIPQTVSDLLRMF